MCSVLPYPINLNKAQSVLGPSASKKKEEPTFGKPQPSRTSLSQNYFALLSFPLLFPVANFSLRPTSLNITSPISTNLPMQGTLALFLLLLGSSLALPQGEKDFLLDLFDTTNVGTRFEWNETQIDNACTEFQGIACTSDSITNL